MAGGRLTDLQRPDPEAHPRTPFRYEVGPRGRVQGAPAGSEARRCVEVPTERRRAAREDPDPTTPRLTGRYEDVDGDYTLMINQAGRHLEFWVAQVLMGDQRRRAEMQFTGAGDLQGDGSFAVTHPDRPNQRIGTLRSTTLAGEPGVILELQSPAGSDSMSFRRLNTVPVVSDAVLARMPRDQPEIIATERAPLLTSFQRWLRDRLSPQRIDPFLNRFFSIDAGSTVGPNHDRYRVLVQLDDYIGEVFSTEGADGWHPSDLPLARFFARNLLGRQRSTQQNAERITLEWIQIMLARMADNIEGRSYNFRHLRENLGLTQPEGRQVLSSGSHQYEVEFTVGGLGGEVVLIGLGGFIGGLEVRKISPPRWHRSYLLWFGQVGAGVGANIQMGQQNDGSGRSAIEWTPDDFPGWVAMVGSGAHGGLGIGGGAGAQMMIIYGTGSLPPLSIDLTSWWSWSSEIGIGADILTLAWGRIYQQHQFNRHVLGPREVTVQHDYAAIGEAADEVHFRLGDALLTEDARQILRVALARELRGFMDRGSTLTITGHADRVDCAPRNVELSRLRAFNVYRAIRDILGDNMLIPESRTYLFWFGEEEAAAAGDRDGLPNDRFRRVNVILNHRLVLSLRGE